MQISAGQTFCMFEFLKTFGHSCALNHYSFSSLDDNDIRYWKLYVPLPSEPCNAIPRYGEKARSWEGGVLVTSASFYMPVTHRQRKLWVAS